jgi:hypothetical protein
MGAAASGEGRAALSIGGAAIITANETGDVVFLKYKK